MGVSVVNKRFIQYSVPAFSVLVYEYAYFRTKQDGGYDYYYTMSTCQDGGQNGKSGTHAGNYDGSDRAGCEILSQNTIPYTDVEITATSSPAGVMTLTSSDRGGYQDSCGETYISAKEHYSYDPSTWERYYSGDEVSPSDPVGAVINTNESSGSITIESRNKCISVNAVVHFNKAHGYIGLSKTGSGSISGSGYHDVGESFTITATPDEGWHFVKWEVESGDDPYNIDGSTSASITKTTLPRTQNEYGSWQSVSAYYKAIFERNTYSCSLNWIPNLSNDVRISASARVIEPGSRDWSNINFPVNGSFTFGARIQVSFTANEDFWCDYDLRWSGDSSSSRKRTFNVPVGGVSAIAYFTRKTYTISISCSNGGDSSGGYFTINGSGHYTSSVTLNDKHQGDTVTVVGHPNEGWIVEYGYYGNSATISCGNEYISVSFKRGTHNVSVTAPEGEGCVYSIDSTGGCHTSQTKQITHGYYIYLLARGENCHKFLRWTGVPSDKQNTNGVYVAVDSDMTIAAVFEACRNDGRLIHCKGDILFDPTSGMPWFQECDCS